MKPLLEGFIIGVLSSLAAALITTSKAWYPRLRDVIRRYSTKAPTVLHIKSYVKAHGFVGCPDGRHPHYYARMRCDLEDERGADENSSGVAVPIYPILANTEYELQEFMGFLIPPLDSGHGRRNGEQAGEDRELALNSDWFNYLQEIGQKAWQSRDKRFLPALDSDFDQNEVRPFLARRIVFFDRRMLRIFLFETDWVFKGYREEIEGRTSLSSRVAYDVAQYAFDIAKVHQAVSAHDVIDCCYLDRSLVDSEIYRDFGLYVIEGISIVYHPVYRKDAKKTIMEERMYFGDTARQRRGISEYRKDFERLWDYASKRNALQRVIVKNHPAGGDYYRRDGGEYYRSHRLSLAYFDSGYYNLICERFREQGIDPSAHFENLDS